MPITVDVTVTDLRGDQASASAVIAVRPPGRLLSGHVVLTETTVIPAGEVWEFDDDATLESAAGNLIVKGTLRAHKSDPSKQALIKFTNVREADFVGGGMEPLETDRGLWVIGDGKLDLVGAVRTPWRRATRGLGVGAVSIELDGDVEGWEPGDELAVTPTAPPTSANFSTLYDYPRVSVVEGRIVHLDRPLQFGHPSRLAKTGRLLTAQVLNLTRNVRVEGTPAGRAHVFIAPEVVDGEHGHTTGRQTMSYVAFRHMGPRQPTGAGSITKGVPGRYAAHFHHNGAGSRGSEMTGMVARDCGTHAFVSHRSDGITWTDCIAHDVYDDPYWYDQAVDTFTPQEPTNDLAYVRCVASLVRTDPPYRGYRLSGFSLGNGSGNRCVDCVAVGVQGTSAGDAHAAGFAWPEGATDVWTFTGCESHNNNAHGLDVWQNTPELHLIEDFTGWHNGLAAISHGAYVNVYHYRNSLLVANRQASINLHSNSHPDAAVGDRQMFEGLTCDQAGLSDYCVRVVKHTLPTDEATHLIGLDFAGYLRAPVGFVNPSTTPTTADLLDIIDCPRDRPDLPWAEFAAPPLPGSHVRVIVSGQVVEEWP